MSTSASTSTSAPNPSSSTITSHPTSTSPSTAQSPESLRQTAEARRYLEASLTSIGTSLSSQLQSRAANLHANTKVLSKQESDLIKATDNLRKENEKLGKVVDEGSRKVKELGNVQNWAEMLERDFLVLQETVRLANGDAELSEDGSDWTGSESWSGSESGGEEREEDGGVSLRREDVQQRDDDGDVSMGDAAPVEAINGKGKEVVREEQQPYDPLRVPLPASSASSLLEQDHRP